MHLAVFSRRFWAVLTCAGVALGSYGRDEFAREDLCAYVEDSMTIHGSRVGELAQCVCQSEVSAAVRENSVLAEAARRAGPEVVAKALEHMIIHAPSAELCQYPAHATSKCARWNPCAFTCPPGFTATPPGPFAAHGRCACDAPGKRVCGGRCVAARAGCAGDAQLAMSVLHSSEDRPVEEEEEEGERVRALDRRAGGVLRGRPKVVPAAWGAWGAWGGGEPGWDCVDAEADERSCGGCSTRFDAYSPVGLDCTEIPGAEKTRWVDYF
ncbi:uncharacterized protein BXZ73DRAFT_97656 [Epithele typhae]|uniref:uncharacterized protein n=1 Tax=Epithele typhae TaxID=378194 RepID=UPI0020080F9D|nr:uncharacterized protein BXZ73DRAFT_97656 [Epithele typhae]KAH9942238.1 hypothetical protein BXZ73DRAFT_97656 [Epithele typhae]